MSADAFGRMTFQRFREMATNTSLSEHEKIGFPDAYRAGYETAIWADVVQKVPVLQKEGAVVVDVGCGCGALVREVVKHAQNKNHTLLLCDSEEMLALVPAASHVTKIAGCFPANEDKFSAYRGRVDVVVVYSVLQHIFLEQNVFAFIDKALGLLKEGGILFLGDIPNVSKRKRFFSRPEGIRCHREYTKSQELPTVNFMGIEEDKIDDAVVFAILQRYRQSGFETYLLPQSANLPMATRREDIVIVR